jgi:hypothetical protein
MFLKKVNGNRIAPSGNQKQIYGGGLPAVLPDDLVVKAQLDTAINSTLEGNDNAFTGNNTHSGTETFTNTTGVTTNTITPATSGAGTAMRVPAGVFTTTPQVLSVTQSMGTYGLSKADGLAVTLPTLSAALVGTKYSFTVVTSSTSVGYVISAATGNVFIGGLLGTIANPDAAADMEFNVAASTVNTLTLGATTACGLAGGSFEVTAISATQWAIKGTVLGSGTVANNLFTTV